MLALNNKFDFQGNLIAWDSIGRGEPIILIHGFPWSSQVWRNIAPRLAKNNTVYYYDMLGTGQSEKHESQNVSPATQNELLSALINHWNVKKPEVIAHDFGGLAALRGYYINKLRYRKLTLIDAVAVLPSGSPFYAHVRKHEQAFAGLPDSAHEALLDAYIQNAALMPLAQEATDIYSTPWKGETGRPAFYRQIAQSDVKYIAEIQSQYGPMENITHLIWADKDTFIPTAQGRELAKLISADNFTPIPNAAHLIQEDAPEAIMAELLLN